MTFRRQFVVVACSMAVLGACGTDVLSIPGPGGGRPNPGRVVHAVIVSPPSLNMTAGNKASLNYAMDADAGVDR